MNKRRIRIGIDVGGTFTHAVAINAEDFSLVGTTKVPTTHTHPNGVAQGIIDSLFELLESSRIDPDEVVLIAHSTTQATNALLEGDVAPVGILGMGGGVEKAKARSETNIGKIELAPGKFLHTFHRFLDTSQGLDKNKAQELIEELRSEGAQVIVAAEVFSVDNPQNEDTIVELCRSMNLLAVNTYDISQLYGLRTRTRTAAVNASMLPRMMETADMTEQSVRAAGIKAPLMIMRSDGGIMDIQEMRRRPILTMLSGPAAGVAAALMYVHITDGIFIEVGGTSTDISAIRNGKALVQTATVGGHRLYLRTLDVRTVGVAGGSIPRLKHRKIYDVGPRSAHIAQLNYASFSHIPAGEKIDIQLIEPRAGDPDDYIALQLPDGTRATVTPTCAANLLGLIPEDNYAYGNQQSVRTAFEALAKFIGDTTPQKLAESLLRRAAPKIANVVADLINEYHLDENLLTLSGGGGGAGALVPFTARMMNLPFTIAPNTEVISAIGVALAMVRDTIERTVINPTERDILNIRKEAEESVLRMGAAPETIEVQIEVDPQKNIVRAVATGSTEMRSRDLSTAKLTDSELEKILRHSLRGSIQLLEKIAELSYLLVYRAVTVNKRLLGLLKQKQNQIRVIDRDGVIRLQIADGDALLSTKENMNSALRDLIERHTIYGDAGREIPGVYIVFRGRILDLSGLIDAEQILALASLELKDIPEQENISLIIQKP
ncbi:hydantoinase/oxoprolinase family protein [Candidatus Sumerlaeota bacterium]|nr:hydantoinase/oxoprolinase family protein [Candidatus Sumerlaeota bacterium]